MSDVHGSGPNPYGAPGAAVEPDPSPAGAISARLPVYCKVVFIVDLALCILRVPLVALSIVGYVAIARQAVPAGGISPGAALAEIFTGLGIAVFGILGNGFLLAGKSWALPVGGLTVCATIASALTGLWELFQMSGDMGDGPEVVGMIIGGVFSLLVRVALLGAYVVALVLFSRWASRREELPLGE